MPSKLYCPRHACQTDGCTKSKPSADSFCSPHQSMFDNMAVRGRGPVSAFRMASFAEEYVAEPSRSIQYVEGHSDPAATVWVPPGGSRSLARSSNV